LIFSTTCTCADPQSQSPINAALQQRAPEYSTVTGLRLCVATYNVNGGRDASAANLYDWCALSSDLSF
jgi:hypothetical protein